MNVGRRKIQKELAFKAEGRGEAPDSVDEGTVAFTTERGSGSPVEVESLMEKVCERANLMRAYRKVKSNKGSPGVDGMSVHQLSGYLERHWPRIRASLLEGTYKPKPVKRVEIPKPGGGVRKLGIPTVLDRFIQQALLQVLQPQWDPTFSGHSYGFRPGRSAHQAVRQAQEYIAQGFRIVVDMDLEKFFDRVNHDMLMGRVAKRVKDKRVLKLIRGFLNAGVLENGLVGPTGEGTPQGGPLSPLLSNLMLDDLDRELERRGHRFVRYADDSNVYVRSKRAGERVMENIMRFITQRLKLKVNTEKSAVARPVERKFLGFSFTNGEQPKRRLAPQTVERFKTRVRELTCRNRKASIEQVVKNLRQYLIGWQGYFGFCETPSVLRGLESWIRRRLRSILWKQWRTGRTRFKALRRQKVGAVCAAQAAASSKGPWRMAHSQAMQVAFPNSFFAELGLPKLVIG